MTYYNTTAEQGKDLKRYEAKAKTQDQVILANIDKGIGLTPFGFQSLLKVKGYDYPITSIRRSLNTLAKQGKMEKSEDKRLGKYGRKNYVWIKL